MRQLDTENANLDLTSLVTVLTNTPDANAPTLCQAYIALGDGTDDLDGSGGDFEVTITIGGQTLEPDPQTVTFSTAARAAIFTAAFPVPANEEVIVKIKSPNAGDTDVDITAYLYEVSALQPVTLGRQLEVSTANNARSQLGDVAHGGSAATFDGKRLALVNDAGPALNLTSTALGAFVISIDNMQTGGSGIKISGDSNAGVGIRIVNTDKDIDADLSGLGDWSTHDVDAVWDEVITEAEHSVADSAAKYLRDTAAGAGVGGGAITTTITCQVGGTPIDGVEVWITTDEAGSNVVAGTLVTDALGEVEFMLDAGDYYAWRQKAGYNFTNPQSITVS